MNNLDKENYKSKENLNSKNYSIKKKNKRCYFNNN